MNTTEKLKLRLKLIKDLEKSNGYIKGFGPKLCRVMDNEHNPLYNIDRQIVEELFAVNKIKIDGLIYKLNLEN